MHRPADMKFLNQNEVDEEEETLRRSVRELSETQRLAFFKDLKPKLRDPDTYAVFNWFFITGIHHFYLGRWLAGITDIALFILGVVFIIQGEFILGGCILTGILIVETYALFRSQIIVQSWNNKVYAETLKRHSRGYR